MNVKTFILISFFLFGFVVTTFCQTTDAPPSEQPSVYPQIKGYVGLVHPIYTMSGEGNIWNFDSYYLVGNPWGINIWKAKNFGFTFEFTPFIRSDQHGTRMSNFLFHPGLLFRLGREFTFITRGAYETSGRFGFTPILNKVVYRSKDYSIFTALLLPARYGNAKTPSYTFAFQFGVGF